VEVDMPISARRSTVLTDSRKPGQAPLTAWAPLDRPWTLVTDDGATDDQLKDFYARPHVEVVVVPTIRDMA
jgi:DeoR/GlpR family transcriptional regulator of sugar metabolism